ncbi:MULTISPECIES: cytochrome c oxidase assembly protein [Sphingomonadales]|uniref:Cytochrome c oxidase assembly protein CtaG n=1 Tax=Edaphosphingomonas haloaromaticamans TaxID=653954 RepID=A0A1S1HB02_9SPHN|nr:MULTISPECIES: cytochrome c oxidase assembly protein [Sphingomonas]AGH50572.1 cytochrome C oxidase assembly protein [Sphingomonas sp. MM-1]OHT19002.1 Cytochrome c oxidase assembly protein CtaG [Sphingomonas haloaromaticamans]
MATLVERNRRVGLMATAIVGAMIGLGFASVPLYRMFCQVTGFNGTTQKAEGAKAPGAVVGKIVNVRFDGNVKPGMAWSFAPEEHVQRVAIGARDMAFYNATNNSDKPVTGSATFNVSPSQAGQYFTKIECFCFKEQTLKPGESVRMPVVFYVDPRILDDPDARDINEITLSYTFFPVDSAGNGG